jgi:hypothetical protein
VDPALSKVLADLRKDVPSRAEAAAIENMRAVVPRKGCDPQDLVSFLESAAEIRLAQAQNHNILPATFYAWYDDQAGQLRFSLVPGRPDAIPFRAPIDLVTASSDVVREALTTWRPGFVPLEELTEVESTEPAVSGDHIRVWARTTKGAV